MVSTRTQTGTIHRLHYDPATLRLNSSSTSQPTSPTTTAPKPRSPTTKRVRKAAAASKPRSPVTKRVSTSRERKSRVQTTKAPLDVDLGALGVDHLMPSVADICEGINFFPSRAWGEREEVGLSEIGRAERNVEIWEEVKRSHAQGGLQNMVPVLEAALEGARERLEDLRRREGEGDGDLGRAGVEDPEREAIEKRLKVLEWALSTCKFEPERENIEGAIEAYRTGAIGYTEYYTILYAGKVVDTAPNYGAFVGDRQERLDRYFATHGPHWIWYEPPLNVNPEARPAMLGSVALHRQGSSNNLGPWHITEGFWKRSDWIRRMKATSSVMPSALEPSFQKQPDGRVFCQDAGPKQAFRMTLDSGATYPSLYKSDFQKLMIDEQNYGAQSVESLKTANGEVRSRLFELFVCVLDQEQKSLVDLNHCAFPQHPRYLGGLCPVVEVQGQLKYDFAGFEISERLSGLLPFLACYISTTPGINTMYLGEDRKDVLGCHRMPGTRRWDIALPTKPSSALDETEAVYGDPKTTFLHRNGRIIDQDDPNMDFGSTITVDQGTPQEKVQRNCPIELIEINRAKAKAEQAKAEQAKAAQEKVEQEMGALDEAAAVTGLIDVMSDRPEVIKAIHEQQKFDRMRRQRQLGFARRSPGAPY